MLPDTLGFHCNVTQAFCFQPRTSANIPFPFVKMQYNQYENIDQIFIPVTRYQKQYRLKSLIEENGKIDHNVHNTL